MQTADLILHGRQIDYATLAMGLLTILLILLVERKPLRKFAYIIALPIVTILVLVLGLDSVKLVSDIAEIPRSLPRPTLPELQYLPAVAGTALAATIISLVQGAGVSQTYPNPDGKFPNPSRDFIGQGIGNIAVSFFRGIPAGGSLSGTAVLVESGARSRWANIFAGIFVAIIVLLFAGLIELLPMTALAGMLVVIGVRLVDVGGIRTVWYTNVFARTAMLITFAATLVVSLQTAVLIGAVISILLYVLRQANQVRIVAWGWPEDSKVAFPEENPAPGTLPSNKVTVLNVYGSLFFAGASTFEDKLPAVGDSDKAVVILALRGRDDMGSTLIGVLQRYATALHKQNGRLMLAGVSTTMLDQLKRTEAIHFIGKDNIFIETHQVGKAMNQALKAAQEWLAQPAPDKSEPDSSNGGV